MLLLPLLVVGCSGGGTYSVEQGQIAQHFLPSERVVGHHPDSLKALTITEDERKIEFRLTRDYESLLRKWSCRFQSVGAGPTLRSPTYATFWSLELSLASLQPERGILSLHKERAWKIIEKRREEYFDTIQIDVYWFVQGQGDGVITGPGAQVKLHVRDSTYRPTRGEHGPLREAFLGSGTALYRRNTLYFSRVVDGTDILKGASKIRLEVQRLGSSSVEYFTWRWTTAQRARRRTKSRSGRRRAGRRLFQ